MIKLVYYVPREDEQSEVQWLREQKIFPAVEAHLDWSKNALVCKVGVIVSSDQALLIKLRHKLELQADYRQR